MKVNIGPYPAFFGPHQIVSWLRFLCVPRSWREWLANWLQKTPLETWCQTLHEWRRKKRYRVVVADYDVWSADNTLAQIILPVLHKYRAENIGIPDVEDIDVPECLRSTRAPAVDASRGEIDELAKYRWEWVVDEMIWAFEQICDEHSEDVFWKSTGRSDDEIRQEIAARQPPQNPDDATIWTEGGEKRLDVDGLKKHWERIQRGTILFGKYFRALWI